MFQRKTAALTLAFLEQATDEMPFPFNASRRTAASSSLPIGCRAAFACLASSSHRSGHVHPISTEKSEGVANCSGKFWPTVDLEIELEDSVAEWQHFYNCDHPQDSLGGVRRLTVCAISFASHPPARRSPTQGFRFVSGKRG